MAKSKIFLVDDDLGTIKVISRMLAPFGHVQFATTGADALRLMLDDPPDIALLDAQMPGINGFQLCQALKSNPELAHVPVIFITSHTDVETEVAGFEVGAVDFITKPVSEPLLMARVKTQLRVSALTQDLRRMATIDGLTNVANRRFFDDAYAKEWQRARRGAEPISVLMVDVDHFKKFNDHYGHAAGDRGLQQVAEAMRQACLRPSDLVARYGGEEFVMLLPNTPRMGAEHVAARILMAVESLGIAHAASPTVGHMTVSIGVSTYDQDSPHWHEPDSDAGHGGGERHRFTPQQLLCCADQALYAAKGAGRFQAWFLDGNHLDAPKMARAVLPMNRLRQLAQML